MNFHRPRVTFLGFVLPAVCFALFIEQCNAQNSAPKQYSNEEKIALDHNNIKLDNLLIPAVKLKRVSFPVALKQIRTLAAENDKDVEPGINIFVKYALTSQARLKDTMITLDLQSVSLRKVLEALVRQADLALEVEPWAVTLRATE